MAVGAPASPDAPRPIAPHERNAELRRAAGYSENEQRQGASSEQRRRLRLVDAKIQAKEGDAALKELAHKPAEFEHAKTCDTTIDYLVSDKTQADTLKQQMRGYQEYMKGGMAALTDETGATPPGLSIADKQALLRDQARDFLLANNVTRDALVDPGTGTIDTARIDRMLANPMLQDAITRRFNELFDPKNLPDKNALDAAAGERKAADKAKTHWTEELRRATDRNNAARKAEDDFNKLPFKGGKTKDTVYKELQVDAQVKRFQAAQERHQKLLDKGAHPSSSAMTAAEAELASARAANPTKIKDYEGLQSEYAALQKERQVAADQFATADAEFTASEAALTAAESKSTKAQLEIAAVSGEFTRGVTNAVGETVRAHIVTEAMNRLNKYATYDNEINAELRQKGGEQLQKFLEARYTVVEQKGLIFKENQFRINKAVADQDLNRLLAIAENAARNPSAGIDVRKEFVRGMLQQARMTSEMQRQLLEDPEFVKGQFNAMVEKAFSMHEAGKTEYNVGERGAAAIDRLLHVNDARLESRMENFFTKHPAGQEISVTTINSNPEVKAKVEEIIQGPVDKDTMKKLEEKKKGSGMLAILLALGVTALTVGDLAADDEGLAAAA